MIYFLGLIIFLILIFLSVIHFYWAVGGKWGFSSVLPTKNDGSLMMKPRMIDSFSVSVILGVIAVLYAEKASVLKIGFLPNWFLNYGLYVVSAVFFLRSIGDFNYIGFFKKIKNTQFAKNDTKYFSPLCLFLSIVGVLIAYLK